MYDVNHHQHCQASKMFASNEKQCDRRKNIKRNKTTIAKASISNYTILSAT